LPDSSEIGAIFTAELGAGAEEALLNNNEWEEVLAGVHDVELDSDFAWDQLDWVEAPADWKLRELQGMIPVVVLETVERAQPQAARKPIKFLVKTEGKRFSIKIKRAGQVTIFLRPPK